LAEHCRELQLNFIDTAGNAYINVPGLTIYVTGERRPTTLTGDDLNYRAYTEVGMKVTFALLCDQALADETYRGIARAAKVGLGTVGPVIKDLENRGHLVQRGRKKTLVNTRELMEAWVTRYPDALRPKLFLNWGQVDYRETETHGGRGKQGRTVRLRSCLLKDEFRNQVVLTACVLVNAGLCDTLLRLGEPPHFIFNGTKTGGLFLSTLQHVVGPSDS
jgi:hypothetical protein